MTRTPPKKLSRRRMATAVLGTALLLGSCGSGDAVSQADRLVEPTSIAAPAGVGSDGSELTLEVVDGGPATGLVLTDHRGFVVYGLTGETSSAIICSNDCADVWIPVRPRSGGTAAALDPEQYSIIERPDGSAQAAYAEIPLYLWTGDSKIGVTGGAGVAGTWFALTVAGGQISE